MARASRVSTCHWDDTGVETISLLILKMVTGTHSHIFFKGDAHGFCQARVQVSITVNSSYEAGKNDQGQQGTFET